MNPRRPDRHSFAWFWIARALALAVVVVFVGMALIRALCDVDPTVLRMRGDRVVLGAILALVSHAAGAWMYAAAYRPFGHRLTVRQAFVMIAIPSLGKYVPGKVTSMAGQAMIARSYGVPLAASAAVLLLTTGLGILAALLLGAAALAAAGRGPLAWIAGVALAAVLAGIAAAPSAYGALTNRLLRLGRRPPLEIGLARADMVRVQAAMLAYQGMLTLGLALASLGFVDLGLQSLACVFGASLLAWTAGFVAVFAPAGLGVREAVFFALLSPAYGSGIAALLALVMRPCQIVVDIAVGGAGIALLGERDDAGAPSAN